MTWQTTAVSQIKLHEGCKLVAYPDPASGGDPWTIGYGATGPSITEGVVWTQQEADMDLEEHVEHIGRDIDDLVKVDLTDNQKAALISFTYNVGLGNFEKSTLLKLLNAGDYDGAAKQFLVWNKAAGKVMEGLVTRRAQESELFLS